MTDDVLLKNPFSPGEIVQLKSGGPLMTVTEVPELRDWLSCSWFWSGRYRTGQFFCCELMRPSAEIIQAAASLKSRGAGT